MLKVKSLIIIKRTDTPTSEISYTFNQSICNLIIIISIINFHLKSITKSIIYNFLLLLWGEI